MNDIQTRFKTIYQLLKDRWTQNAFVSGPDIEEDQIQSIQKLIRSKKKLPREVAFCMTGAVMYVNGPREKEIMACLAIAIKSVTHGKNPNLLTVAFEFLDNDKQKLSQTGPDLIIQMWEYLLDDRNKDECINIIADYNDGDKRRHDDILKMIKLAMKIPPLIESAKSHVKEILAIERKTEKLRIGPTRKSR